MADNQFENAEAQYYRLRGQLAAGRITKDEFEAALKALMFQDLQGRHWMIGADSGTWYVYDGKQWTEASPQPTLSAGRVVAAPQLQSRARGGNRTLLYGGCAAVLLLLCGITVLVGAWSTGILRINPGSRATPTFVPYLNSIASSPTPRRGATSPITVIAGSPSPQLTITATVQITETPTTQITETLTAQITVTPTAQITATPTPPPPGLYVTNLRLEPAEPHRRDEVGFYPTFLNATGAEQHYRWAVYIFHPENMRKSFGETSKFVPTIPIGTGEQKTLGTWKLGVGSDCEDFLARVQWSNEDNQLTPFYKPDGSIFELFYRVCP